MQIPRDGQKALEDFWGVYEEHQSQITEKLLHLLAKHPEFAATLKAMTPEQMAEQNERSQALQRRAIVEGEWEPYLADLRTQGANYAQAGVSFPAWFDLVAAFRTQTTPYLLEKYGKTPKRLLAAMEAMDQFIDNAMAVIGQTYLKTKEDLIGKQQEAIYELSTPVLQLNEGLLIVPIIGIVDTLRARQLTEHLLQAIRTYRAKAVVIDITGVSAVDTKVANHLTQTVEAVRLMGASAVITGLSADVAQTLVTLGIELSKLITVGDLQGGIDHAYRLLGYRVVRRDPDGGEPRPREI